MSDSASASLTTIEQIFYDLIWLPGIKLGELALENAVPLLKTPGINKLEEGVINILSRWAYSQFILFVDVSTIELANAVQQEAYEKASLQLKIIAQGKGLTSDDFIKARDAAKAAMSAFTDLNPADK